MGNAPVLTCVRRPALAFALFSLANCVRGRLDCPGSLEVVVETLLPLSLDGWLRMVGLPELIDIENILTSSMFRFVWAICK